MSKRTIRTDLFDEVQKRLQHMQSTVDRLESGDRSCLSLDELTAELQYLCESVEMGRLLFQTSLSDASANLDSV